MLNLLVLILCTLPRVHVRDVQDRLLVGIKHIQDVISIRTGIEEVPNIERFQVFVTVQLLIIGLSDGVEFRLVMRI